jgi:hypothetical protein
VDWDPALVSGPGSHLSYAAVGAGGTSTSCGSGPGSSRGSQASQLERYQFRSPSTFIVAGRSTPRARVASIRIAAASPTPNCLNMSIDRAAKIEKTATVTTAALVKTPAVDLMPCAIASCKRKAVQTPELGGRFSGSLPGVASASRLRLQCLGVLVHDRRKRPSCRPLLTLALEPQRELDANANFERIRPRVRMQ